MLRILMVVMVFALGGCASPRLSSQELASADHERLREAMSQTQYAMTGGGWASDDAYLAAIRLRAIDLHPTWDQRTRTNVRTGKIHEGMPREAVWYSWGPPDEIQVDRYPGKEEETWQYGYAGSYSYTSGVHVGRYASAPGHYSYIPGRYTRVYISDGAVSSWWSHED